MHYVFIESNTTGTGRLAIERLTGMGQKVTFLSRQPSRYPFLKSMGPAVEILTVETNDITALSIQVEKVLQRNKIDALMTFSTFYVALVAELAQKYGFRSLNAQSAMICHDKSIMRLTTHGAGFPTPNFWIVDSCAGAKRVANETMYPCVVKPAADSGSNGVVLVHNAQELVAHYDQLSRLKFNDREQAQTGKVLVEAFLDGSEFSVETMTLGPSCTHVLGVTRKYLSPPPYFVETGHDFPADIPESLQDTLKRATLTALEAVGYDFGPAHTEIRLTADGPVVIEINPRLAGGMIPELVRLATGVDVLSVVLGAAAGIPVQLTTSRMDVASIRFITARRDGVLRHPPDLETARCMPLIRIVEFDKALPCIVRTPKGAGDRLGFVISSGPDRATVLAAANRALEIVPLDVETGTIES